MNVKVLGLGCANCRALKANVKQALATLEIEAEVQEVMDFEEILSYGIASTPALVVDGSVLLAGRVPSTDQIRSLLAAAG